MDAEWLTYREAANRLGSNIEAIRQRAIRCRWPRMLGNDKRARIQIPEGLTNPLREGNDRPSRGANERAYDRANEASLIKALEAHVRTLKEQLAAAEARADKTAADLAAEQARTTQAIAAFESLAEKLEALAEARRPWWRRLVNG
jgi:chromosome segregation ATPase